MHYFSSGTHTADIHPGKGGRTLPYAHCLFRPALPSFLVETAVQTLRRSCSAYGLVQDFQPHLTSHIDDYRAIHRSVSHSVPGRFIIILQFVFIISRRAEGYTSTYRHFAQPAVQSLAQLPRFSLLTTRCSSVDPVAPASKQQNSLPTNTKTSQA